MRIVVERITVNRSNNHTTTRMKFFLSFFYSFSSLFLDVNPMNELSLNRHTQTKTGTKHKLNEAKKTTHWKTKRKMYTKSKQEKKNFKLWNTGY